jgi:hypothetical protein
MRFEIFMAMPCYKKSTESQPVFQRNLSPPLSGSVNKQSMKEVASRAKDYMALYPKHRYENLKSYMMIIYITVL